MTFLVYGNEEDYFLVNLEDAVSGRGRWCGRRDATVIATQVIIAADSGIDDRGLGKGAGDVKER